MAIIVLLLVVCGLITAISLAIFFCEHLLPLLAALSVARWTYLSGGGWPGALFTGGVALVFTMAIIRIGLALIPSWAIRLALAILWLAPTLIMSFLISSALLSPGVPSALWRVALASVVAVTIAAGAGRRLLSSGSATAPDQGIVARRT